MSIMSGTGLLDTTVDTGRTESATQRVYAQLRKQIIVGDIAPGEKLKVESLKKTLDSGASPIREALSLLTSDQLVERFDQRGFRAAPASVAHFNEILALRCQLDVIALDKSIAIGNNAWEERVVLANHRLNQVKPSNSDEYESRHKDFHMSLLDACESPILIRFCDQLYDLNIRYRYLAGKSLHYKKRDIAIEHQHIVDAVVARDADSASKQLRNHYVRTGEFLSGIFDGSPIGIASDDHQ